MDKKVHCANQQLSWWSARAPQPAHPHQSQSAQPARPAQNQQRMPHSCKISMHEILNNPVR